MKYSILLLTLLLSLSLTGKAQNEICNQEEAVQNVVIGLFDGLAELNGEKIKQYCSPDIQLLETGKIWTIDSLLLRVNNMKARITDFKRVNKIDFLQTKVRGDFAWISYFNEATITANNKTVIIKWLESVTLKKEKKEWRIDLLHSTELERSK